MLSFLTLHREENQIETLALRSSICGSMTAAIVFFYFSLMILFIELLRLRIRKLPTDWFKLSQMEIISHIDLERM